MTPKAAVTSIYQRFPYKRLPLNRRCNVDRYGFSSLVAADLRLPFIPRSFSNWIHGWVWWDIENVEDLGFMHDPPNINKIVNKEVFRKALLEEGISNVFTASLPYAYLQSSSCSPAKEKRLPGSILFVPDHSSESNKVSHNIHNYLDFVDVHAKDFAHVSVLIYGLDFCALAPLVEERGYLPVFGASPDCSWSMIRTKALFEVHDHVSTNIMGSHVLYALSAGAKVSICGPYQEKAVESHRADIEAGRYTQNYIERMLYYCSLEYLSESKYSHLVVDRPDQGVSREHELNKFIDEELGVSRLPPLTQIRRLLGWEVQGQINGYLNGAARRLKRLFC